MSYYLVDSTISEANSKVLAVGVALLFTYATNFGCQIVATFVLHQSEDEKTEKNLCLEKLFRTSRALYLFAVASIFSIYPPYYYGTQSAVLAWVSFLIVGALHALCFMPFKIGSRSLWSIVYLVYHVSLLIWILLALILAYTWSSNQLTGPIAI